MWVLNGYSKYGVLRVGVFSVLTFFKIDAFLFLDPANCFYNFGFFLLLWLSHHYQLGSSNFLSRRSRDCSFAWVC